MMTNAQKRQWRTGRRRGTFRHRAQGTGHRAQSTGQRAQALPTEADRREAKVRAQGTEHRAQEGVLKSPL